jgi:hypothetical protein
LRYSFILASTSFFVADASSSPLAFHRGNLHRVLIALGDERRDGRLHLLV